MGSKFMRSVERRAALRLIWAYFLIVFMTPLASYAFQPSAAQLEAFKTLSPSQQKQLAKRYGVELPESLTSSSPSVVSEPVLVEPRQNSEGIKDTGERDVLDISESINDERSDGEYSAQAEDYPVMNTENELVAGKVRRFGYDLFAGNPTTFAPATDIPIPSNYVIGPGDTVILQLYGKENVEHELIVSRQGIIQIPEIGPLHVVGQTFREFKDYLNDTLDKKTIGIKANITMGSLRSIRVFILGEAHKPGSYTVSSLSTITNALFVSGGINSIGSLRGIQLKRKGRVVGRLDLYDLLLKGDTSKDLRLQPGDVIFIPPISDTVTVNGEVKRPAIYELKNEKSMQSVIAMAGGFTSTAYPQFSRLERVSNKGSRTLIDLDLTSSSHHNSTPKSGDIIHVPSILDELEGAVSLKGHVRRPMQFSWRKNLRLRDIIKGYDDLLPDPDMQYGLIVRKSEPKKRIKLISFKLADVFESRSSDSNLLVQSGDEIIVFGASEPREAVIKPLIEDIKSQATASNPSQTVFISGYVKFPGQYPFIKNMSPKDLIMAAGGFKVSAYTLGAEVTRYNVDSEQIQELQRIDIDFKSHAPFQLKSRDQLFIKRIPNWAEKETVKIEGEVRFPGTYPIYKGDTIVQLIDRAGGVSDLGDPSAAIFLREDLRKREQQQLLKYKAQIEKDLAELKLDAAQDTTGKKDVTAVGGVMLEQLSTAEATGRLVIDLPSIIQGKAKDKLLLRNGDRLIIPRESSEVTVVGEVQFPTSHIYEANMDVFQYIDISGGFNSSADDDRIYVIKPSGKIISVKNGWFRNRNSDVGPGDTIVIPYDTDATSPMVYWTGMSQILFQLATTVAALNTVGVF